MADSVLTNVDYQRLKQAVAHSQQTKELLEKATRCGIPCEEPMATIELLQEQMLAVLKNFFPDRP